MNGNFISKNGAYPLFDQSLFKLRRIFGSYFELTKQIHMS